MYLLYKENKYPCLCMPGPVMIYRELPDDFPAPVSGELTLCADDGFVLRTDVVGDYLRQTFENGRLVLTNYPEVEPMPEPEHKPTAEEILDAMLGVTNDD